MITRLKLKPGRKGTKKLSDQYGDALICVRYRYDETNGQRVKTVELIVEQTPWTPPKKNYSDNELVPVQIGFSERALREAAKTAKGR